MEEALEEDVYTQTLRCRDCGSGWGEGFGKVKRVGAPFRLRLRPLRLVPVATRRHPVEPHGHETPRQGRPALFRAIGADVIVNNLLEEYQREAEEVLGELKRREESQRDAGEEDASAWMVRGERAVTRRLAELVFAAKSDVFSISGFPAKYPLSARTALKAAAKRGVHVRPVCMIRPTVDYEITPKDAPSVIEYRTVKALSSLVNKPIDPYDEKLISGFSHMSGLGAMVIIDESLAYDIMDDGKDPERAVGIVIKAPGVPRIQKATAERILGLYTRRI